MVVLEEVVLEEKGEVVEEEAVEVWVDIEQLMAEVAVAGGCAVQQDFWLPTVSRENSARDGHRRLS